MTNILTTPTPAGNVTTVFTHDGKRHGFLDGDYVVRLVAPRRTSPPAFRCQWVCTTWHLAWLSFYRRSERWRAPRS